MSAWTTTLRLGLPLRYDGEQFTVAEIEGRRILLRQTGIDDRLKWRQVDVSVLLSHPTTEFLVEAPQPELADAAVLGALSPAEDEALGERFGHVQEVRTGFRRGCAELALPGEPCADYAPGVPLMARYAAKAAELGVDPATVRRWVAKAEAGPAGLVDRRSKAAALDRADPRWVDAARSVLAGHVKSSRPVRALVLTEIEERLLRDFGPGVVRLPGRTAGYELLKVLAAGTNAFDGSTKGKRSIANRPAGVYGRLRATRPGEYVVLDTNRLDVFAMEPVTCRWVQCELTVACARLVTDRICCAGESKISVDGALHQPRRRPARGAAATAGRAA